MLDFHLFQVGFCTHCQRITLQGGILKKVRYPSLCALIQHPQFGNILYDTGYSQRFCTLTSRFPQRVYQWVTPVTLTQDLKSQLKIMNIDAEEINIIIISHFHADHLGGLSDFPNAQFICHPKAWRSVKQIGTLRGLTKAFIPELLPPDFDERLQLIDVQQIIKLKQSLKPFVEGYNILGDGSLIAIDLPGHASGHIGILFENNKQEHIFLIGDSCWHQQSFQSLRMPSFLTYFIHEDRKAYKHTIKQLHELHVRNSTIKIIPSHCQETAHSLIRGGE